MNRLVLTGAAGRLGSYLREPLSKITAELVSSDIEPDLDNLYPGERYVPADLSELDAVERALEGAEMVVHFGGISDEAPFDEILQANIIGCYNVWEAAYRQGVKRIVYASSVHAVGMHPTRDVIGLDAAHRPDGYYGLSKCFAEDLARMYWEKRGLEAVCLRIFSCAPVKNARSLGTWLSYDDMIQLVQRSIDTPTTGYCTVYGISNNDRAPVDNSGAHFLGYRPKDNAEQYAKDILASAGPFDPTDVGQMTLGGPFSSVDMGQSGQALLGIKKEKK